jgi:hypothetical protein
MAKMDDKQLGAILDAEKSDALSSQRASRLASEREQAMAYYQGDMDDMPTVEGRSKAVSTDVFDTIEGMLPDLLEIFAGGDEVVRFDPVGPEDVPMAEQETQYVNHVFLQKNPGFLVLYSMIKDALLSKVGIVKVHWEENEEEERETFLDQPEDVFALVQSKPDVEIIEHTANENGTHDFTVMHRKSYGCAKVEPVPPEEFGISRRARSVRDASYCFHEVSRSQQDLIDEGYDPDEIRKLPTYGQETGLEENARDTIEENANAGGDSSLNTVMRPIRITEHYIRMDYDGKGTRLYRVTTGGESCKVLTFNGEKSVVPVDFMPFAAMTPVIITHRFFGRSIADLVMEIQRIKTALLRALLDNAYLAVNPITEVSEENASATTIDDLLVRRPGGMVRTKRSGGINIIEHPGVGDDVFPLFEYQDQVREWRTGITRQGQGMDPNVLNNQSATAAAQLYSAAKARLRLIARIFAETGIKDLFWLLHGTIRKNASQQETVQLSNQWVTVDPRSWKTRNDLTISVGLGTGSKQEQLAGVQLLIGAQEKALANGLTNLVSVQNLYNSAKKLTRLVGEKDPGQFFTDPQTQPPPQPKPDPEMLKIQGQLEVEKMQAQADIALSDKKLQADLAKITAEVQMSRENHMMELQQAREMHAIKMEELRQKSVADQVSMEMKARSEAMRHEQTIRQGSMDGEREQHKANGQDKTHKVMIELLQQLAEDRKPKRIRKDADGSWVSEAVN